MKQTLPFVELLPENIIPASLPIWCRTVVRKHEEYWGFDDGLSVIENLFGSRGAVPEHVDTEFVGGTDIIGLILETGGQSLEVKNTPGLPLKPGTFFRLDPEVPHGTTCQEADDLLVFLSMPIPEADTRTPPELAAKLVRNIQCFKDSNPSWEPY